MKAASSQPANMLIEENQAPASSLLLHMQLLGRRLYLHSWVRFLVAVAIALGALVAKHIVGIRELDASGLIVLACLLAFFNVFIFFITRRYKKLDISGTSYHFLLGMMHTTVFMDFLFLTVALWMVGGAKSPFQAFYLLHVILAAILLSPKAAYLQALLGYAMLSTLVVGEWSGFIPSRFPIGAVNSTSPLDGRFALTVLVVQGMLMSLAVFLVTGLVHLLRQGELSLRQANLDLEHLSNMHRDFLHITIHDLKSPIAAAGMLTHTLEATGPALSDAQMRSLVQIRRRLADATSFLRDFELLASLNAPDVGKHQTDCDLMNLLQAVVEENQELAKQHQHELVLEKIEKPMVVHGIERLLHEAVSNLVTNAIKYTPDQGNISVRVQANGGIVRIEVEDNGIGIDQKDQPKLFKEFIRIRHKSGHAVRPPGTGLGLSLVRRIAEMHHGQVGLVSEPGKGSIFFIELPLV